MVAKIIAWGRDRPEALARLRVRAARDHRRAARRDDDEVLPARPARPARGGGRHRRHRLAGPRRHRRRRRARPATPRSRCVQVAIDVSDAEEARERAAFLRVGPRRPPAGLARRRPHRRARLPRAGLPADRRPDRPATATGSSSTAGTSTSTSTGSARWRAGSASAAERFSVVAVARGHRRTWSRSTASPTGSPGTRAASSAPRPRRSSSRSARRSGEDVEAGQTIVVLESMKMETAVRAPFAGPGPRGPGRRERPGRRRRARCCGSTGPATRPRRSSASGSTLPGGRRPRRRRPRAGRWSLLAAMQALITGYDVSAELRPAAGRRVRRRPRRAARGRRRSCCTASWRVLTTFADLSELSRNRPTSEEEEADEQVHSPREYFHSYLHSLDIDREGLPESFRARLSRALLHYGVARPGARPRAGGGGVPHLPGPAADGRPAARRPRAAGPLADRGRSCRPARCGTRSPRCSTGCRRHPAALPVGRRPRPRRALPVLRGAAGAAGPAGGPRRRPSGCWPSWTTPPARRRRRRTCERVEALVASPEPLIRLLAQRLERADGRPGPGARGAHPPLLPQPRPGERAGLPARRPLLRHRRLRAERPAAAPGRADGPDATTCRRRWPRWRRLVGRDRGPVDSWSSTSTCPGRTGRRTPTRWPSALREHARRASTPLPAVRRVTVTVLHPGRRRRDGDLPARRPTGSPRSGSSAACTR